MWPFKKKSKYRIVPDGLSAYKVEAYCGAGYWLTYSGTHYSMESALKFVNDAKDYDLWKTERKKKEAERERKEGIKYL